jgi:hypothetical protein
VKNFFKQSPPSSRSDLNTFQREHFCSLIQLLIEGALGQFQVRVTSDLPEDGWERFTDNREYQLFLTGAYACGFVCSDLRPDVDIDRVNRSPENHVDKFDLKDLRHFVHTMMRSERSNFGFCSAIWESMRSGTLELLMGRLAHDPRLLDPL